MARIIDRESNFCYEHYTLDELKEESQPDPSTVLLYELQAGLPIASDVFDAFQEGDTDIVETPLDIPEDNPVILMYVKLPLPFSSSEEHDDLFRYLLAKGFGTAISTRLATTPGRRWRRSISIQIHWSNLRFHGDVLVIGSTTGLLRSWDPAIETKVAFFKSSSR